MAVRGGQSHYCAQLQSGDWECFGRSDAGETQVPAGESLVDLDLGSYQTCGIRPDGTALCFGAGTINEDAANNFGQSLPPSEVEDVFLDVASGTHTSCGVRVDGRLECWGRYTEREPEGTDLSLEPPGVCGDGVRDLPEACDDANQVGGDGCSADCESDESCGNGRLDPGELCDDGVEAYGDFCDGTCTTSTRASRHWARHSKSYADTKQVSASRPAVIRKPGASPTRLTKG